MTITATARVPAQRRLIDAPTLAFSRTNSAACPPWCRTEHPDPNGDQLHETDVATVVNVRDGVLTDRMYLATVGVASFTSGDGTMHEPAAVELAITPVRRPGVDESAVDGMPADLLRHLAARIMCGAECGESVSLSPTVAVALGRALIEAGQLAGGPR